MAIGVGSKVSVKLDLLVPVVQGPVFGISESASTPFTITWSSNGARVASIPETSLDEILVATAGTELVGQRVIMTIPEDQSNYGLCTCIWVYRRNGSNVALLQNQAGEYYFEALVSNVTKA